MKLPGRGGGLVDGAGEGGWRGGLTEPVAGCCEGCLFGSCAERAG